MLWDTEAEDGEGGFINEHCLVHAFIKQDDSKLIDVHGISDMDDTLSRYPCNKALFKDYTANAFKKVIKQKGWEYFEEGEASAIKRFITKNITIG